MRKIVLFLTLLLALSCVKDTKQPGYNCENGNCIATFDNPTYLTLQDCQSVCAIVTPPPTVKTGTVTIYVSFNRYCAAYPHFNVTVGLGYTSTDVVNDAFFVSTVLYSSGSFTQKDLKPAIYYYKATKSKGNEHCPPATVTIKNGSFEILSGKATPITISFYN